MKRSLFFGIPLILFLAITGRAQQITNASIESSAPVQETEKLSPRQIAEMRADILMARKEFEDAIRGYDAILKDEPKNAGLLNKVGTVEYELKHYPKAISYYQKAISLGTDVPTIYSNMGYAYFSNKEYPQAMDSFAKALALDPTVFDRKGGNGTIIQDRSSPDPGLFYFFVAKSFAQVGDAEHAAHYLKLARDDGYKDYLSAQTDPAFASVIKDPGVQEVLQVIPAYAAAGKKPISN